MRFDLVKTSELLPLELVFPTHLSNLTKMIKKDGYMKQALIVDSKTKIVLDGSHRHIFLLREGFKFAPVHLVDYDDEHIRVGTSRLHRLIIKGKVDLSKELVIKAGLAGKLFQPRTTRHFFPFLRPSINYPLEKLSKGKKVDVSSSILDVEVSEEINHNLKYISEIEDETEEILRYLMEGFNTKKYLLEQIRHMESHD